MAFTKIVTDLITDLAVTTAKIAAGAVTGAKLAMGSDAQGDVLYHNGTAYARLGAGTSGKFLQTKGAAANPVWASHPLATPDFTSSEQTVTADTKLDVAHSLGAVPSLVYVTLKCNTTDLGYAANDEIPVGSLAAETADKGAIVMSDATNVSIVQAASILLVGKATFNTAAITVAKWRWVVRAWA
jgi:hypothetical protein